jgi:HK97 family phage major capsid protein
MCVAVDQRLQLLNADAWQEEATGQGGGFYVPQVLAAGLIDSSLEGEIVRPRAKVVPMSSAAISLPWLEDVDRTGVHASGQWLGELDIATRQVEKPVLVTLTAKKCAIYGSASLELLADAPAFEADLQAQLARRLGYTLDQSFLTGTGVGTPLGVLNSPALITVTKESGQAANTILFQNIVKMASRLAPVCWSNAVWLAHPSTLPQLYAIQNVVWNVAATEHVGGSAVAVHREQRHVPADGPRIVGHREVAGAQQCR